MRRILKGLLIVVLALLAVIMAIVGFLLSAVMGMAVSLASIGAPFILVIFVAVSNWINWKKEKPPKQ